MHQTRTLQKIPNMEGLGRRFLLLEDLLRVRPSSSKDGPSQASGGEKGEAVNLVSPSIAITLMSKIRKNT